MTDTSQAEIPPAQTNGYSNEEAVTVVAGVAGVGDDDDAGDRARMRPVDIDADVREMERRKRVEIIMGSKLFREELERIIETQLKDGNTGPSGLLQQISDMVGVSKQSGNVFKSSSSCVIPINDIRGIEAMGYGKGEKILRCKLACLYRLIDLLGWCQSSGTLITARLNQDDEQFLVSPYGMLFHEVTASGLIKVDMRGAVLEQGTTNFSANVAAFSLHAAVHSARPDIKCVVHVHTPAVVAVSALKQGLMPLSRESVVIGDVSTHTYLGGLLDPEEKDKLARNLGPNNKVLLLSNQGALCLGETIEEAFFNARNTVLASETQLKLLPVGVDNLILINDEIKKKIYDAAHKQPESTPRPDQPSILEGKVERKWRVGGVEFEALMRMLDNAGFRTGYIYRHPLIKGEPPKPKNDCEVPPAVSSLGYLLEEEELYRQGLWRKLEGGKKGNDRSRWLNSPNTYQKVEILETGTPDPKKITKWVADGSPSHSSTPVKIDSALQFVPKGTNPKEFKQRQQQIKDYRRADKISAGPQSHILEGVTWEEARKMQDAAATHAGDQVVLMGAASKGIIQRGHQHNAAVYKSAYAKNPFDSITDEELDEYKMVVEKKNKGEYDTDFSESEGLSSAAINKRMDGIHIRSPTSVTSETEEESRDEPQILRIETKTAPRPSQPEVVLSDGYKIMVNNQNQPSCYRTYSHSGFPKGSYTVPNPKHFHIVRESQIAIRKPVIVSVMNHNTSSHYLFNHGQNNRKSTVTLNLGNSHSVSVNISMDSLKGFIFPFANALNYRDVPHLSSQGSQTSYMNNFSRPSQENRSKVNYTPLFVDSYRTCQIVPESSDKTSLFEKRILTNLHKQMIVDLNRSSEYEPSNNCDTSEEVLAEFNENDQESNESLIEVTPEIAAMLPSSSESSSATLENGSNDRKVAKESSIFSTVEKKDSDTSVVGTSSPNISNTTVDTSNSFSKHMNEIAEKFIQKLSEVSVNSENVSIYQDAIHEAKNILQQISDGPVVNKSIDEGIEDCTITNEITVKCISLNKSIEEGIMKLSDLILDYLIQQCFELKELILFPEVLHDPNLNKLLGKLTFTFYELYGDTLTSEQKNGLRLKLASYILKQLEINEQLNNSEDSSISNTVSDKIFSISEFLNDILDHFFISIENGGQFGEFAKSLVNNIGNVCQSTPEKQRKPKQSTSELEVTSFHKTTNSKSGAENYWIALSHSPTSLKPQNLNNDIPKTPVINVDDIKLKPPEDLEILPKKVLSPIIEEPRINLFDSRLTEDDLNLLLNTKENTEYEVIEDSENEDFDKHQNIMSDIPNSIHSYVAFDQPEINVVVCTGVNFFRTKTINSNAFIKSDKVVFRTRDSENKENEPLNDSGDWMGFESAKF